MAINYTDPLHWYPQLDLITDNVGRIQGLGILSGLSNLVRTPPHRTRHIYLRTGHPVLVECGDNMADIISVITQTKQIRDHRITDITEPVAQSIRINA